MIQHWYSKVDLRAVIWEGLSKLEKMSTIWFSNTTTTPLPTPNGTTSKSTIPASTPLTNSTSSTLSSLKAHTTKAWSHWYTQNEMLNRVKVKVLDGTEMGKIFAISRTHWRRRQEDSTIHSLFRYSSQMITMRYILHIATHTHIQIAPNYSRNSANLNPKTGYEKR